MYSICLLQIYSVSVEPSLQFKHFVNEQTTVYNDLLPRDINPSQPVSTTWTTPFSANYMKRNIEKYVFDCERKLFKIRNITLVAPKGLIDDIWS